MRNIFFCTCVLLIMLTGCTSHQGRYKVGMSQCLDDAWRQKMNAEMDREILLHPDISLHRRVAYGNSILQCAQIDSFIKERVDVLIVSPNEAEEVRPAITRAFRAGIPVIIADRRVSGNEWTAFIGGDNYHVGTLMAEWVESIQRNSDHPLHVIEVCGMPGSMPEKQRHQGLTDGLQMMDGKGEQPIIVSLPGWQDAYKTVREYLRTHMDVEAIVAQNDLMAISAAQAVRDTKGYGKGSVHIMGVDGIIVGLQAIVDGDIECTALYPSRGDLLIQTAAQIIANEPYARDSVLETIMIDATSAYPLLKQYQARLHDLETLKIVRMQANSDWQTMRSERTLMIVIIVIVGLLLVLAILFVVYMQRRLQKEIDRKILPQLEEVQEAIQLNTRDVAFAERMRQIVDDHLTDSRLNVEYLADALQMDRTQLFRRVKAITGKGPMEYIRERRLIRADEMLRTTDKTVKQIARELGFSNPGYFSKYYNDYFGHLPGQR